MELLARNRVEDFRQWKLVFDEQTDAAAEAGLKLARMWRAEDDPNTDKYDLAARMLNFPNNAPP